MLHFAICILAVRSSLTEKIKARREQDVIVTITGCSDSFEKAYRFLNKNRPDILLIDDLFFDKTELIHFIDNLPKAFSSTKIIIYTGSRDAEYFKSLLNSGSRGIIQKKSSVNKIFIAIKLAGTGSFYFSRRVKYLLDKDNLKNRLREHIEKLTKREKDVMELLFQKFKNKAIAEKLSISVKTAENHKEKIKEKFNLKNIKELFK